uniref:VWFA domain-containing protein n=1 Tax=Rhipicephalus appendiculatus TaxID=34631 RepID=A0A131YWQ7_RHIAP
MAAGSSEFRDLRSISALVFVVLCLDCGARCAAGGDAPKPSIKLFGNIGKFANRSGVHEFLKSNLFLASLAKESSASSLASAAESATSDRQEAIADSIYLQVEARSLGSHLRKISNEELGVTAMQGIYDELPFTTDNFDAAKQLDEIADKLQKKLLSYVALLNRSSDVVEEVYRFRQRYAFPAVNPCCLMDPSVLMMDNHFGTEITNSTTCDTAPLSLPKGVFSPGPNLTDVFRKNLESHPSIKWQYFVSTAGIHTEYPAYSTVRKWSCRHVDDLRHRDIYLATVQPHTKHVVIVIDHGNSLSPKQLVTAKAVAKYVLSTLSHHDRVGLIGLSGEPRFPQSDKCLSKEMAFATFETKYHFGRFIDALQKAPNSTNHRVGFSKAFEMIQKSLRPSKNTSKQAEALIVYVSRGLLSSIADARPVLETIASGHRSSGHRVVINTYAVIDDGKPIMYETSFLKDIAELNFVKYNVPGVPSPELRGAMVTINSTENLSFTMGQFYSALSFHRHPTSVHFSLPWFDNVSKDLVISISKAVVHHGVLLGVAGVDISVSDMAEDIVYFSKSQDVYSFLVEKSGVAIVHPALSKPSSVSEQPMHTDILHLENRPGFHGVRQDLLNASSGENKLTLASVVESPDRASNLVEAEPAEEQLSEVVYRWTRVAGTPYVVAIVSLKPSRQQPVLRGTTAGDALGEFYYHRLDLVSPPQLCRHMKQLSTLAGSTLFLSAACFLSPFEYLSQEETKSRVQGYMAYLIDTTMLIANPGLKPDVRDEVLAIARITSEWKRTFESSEFTKHVVRRYAATSCGAMVAYPGTVLERSYDPTERDWFTRALEHPGKVVLTAPYLDMGGAGYIVTLSHTIYQAKPDALHSPSDAVVAVIGMDLTLGYFYKLLTVNMDVCEMDKIACFILDDRGYLIAHPSLMEPTLRATGLEQQHITRKEPLVVSDITNHKGFVKKKECNNYGDWTVQRFYKLNTSLEGILSNSVHGEHCAKYQITAIPGTNAFLGIVNHTCDTVRAFCPCSMVDRLCLNCHRMEQRDCECPCECPLQMNLCTGDLAHNEDRSSNCPRFARPPQLPKLESYHFDSLQQCFDSECSSRMSEKDCSGVLGCEWCSVDMDGETALKTPFCHEQPKCFGGVLGARTPYADEIIGALEEDFPYIRSTPLGPVAGGMIGAFCLIAFLVYCYKNRVTRSSSSQYGLSYPAAPLQGGQVFHDIDDSDFHTSPSPVGPHNLSLAGCTYDNRVVVSPYRVNTAYRRPPGGDSDHGYSTMTPHEDSEHLQYFEPLLTSKEKGRSPPPAPQPSLSSRASSPAQQQQLTQFLDPSITRIPKNPASIGRRNSFQASVEVHAAAVR